MLTRKLCEIYPSIEEFDIDKVELSMEEYDTKRLYRLLMGRYGTSRTRYSNEDQFRMELFMRIDTFYPTVLATLAEQKKLREMTDDELAQAGNNVVNTGAHNTGTTRTDADTGATQLAGQVVSKSKYGKLKTAAGRIELLSAGVENAFLNRFSNMFRATGYYKETVPLPTLEQLSSDGVIQTVGNPTTPNAGITEAQVRAIVIEMLEGYVKGGVV